MRAAFLSIIESGVAGSIIIALVFVFRAILRKAPKRLVCILWLLVAVRLLLPFHLETDFSLQPNLKPILTQVQSQQTYIPEDIVPAAPTHGENVAVSTENAVTGETLHVIEWVQIAAIVWLLGVSVMVVYTLIAYIKLKLQVRTAVHAADGAWESEGLGGAFLFGYIKPRIFLPADLKGTDREYVLSHERAHIAFGDHWTKLIGFACLTLHWFNPLVWIAYRLLCRDLEIACDEQVIRRYSVEERKAYSKALLSCSAGSRPVSACPIAFGEVDVKERIMKVLNYKKPGFWICLVCLIAAVAISVFFLTDATPKYDTVFEEYASMIGLDKDEFYRKIGTTEEKGTIADLRTHVLSDPLEIDGVKYWVTINYDELSGNRIYAVEFKTVSFNSFDEMAEKYLSLYEWLYSLYGETDEYSDVFSDLQQMQNAYENRAPKRGSWDVESRWALENVTEIYPNAQEYMNYLATWEYGENTIKNLYGNEFVPRSLFWARLSCKVEEEVYMVNVCFFIRVEPTQSP